VGKGIGVGSVTAFCQPVSMDEKKEPLTTMSIIIKSKAAMSQKRCFIESFHFFADRKRGLETTCMKPDSSSLKLESL
jgi:hypothetical protein